MVAALNSTMNALFGAVDAVFGWMPPWLGLSIISALLCVVLLLLFKWTSPQEKIATVKDRLWGSLHEIRLFQDDLGVLTRAIVRLFRDNFLYFACCSVALIPMIVVVAPVLFQFDAFYGFDPLKKGDVVVLEARLAEGLDPIEHPVTLDLPDGALVVEEGPVRCLDTRDVAWRLRVAEEGAHEVTVTVDGQAYAKRIDAESSMRKISPGKYKASASLLDALMFPAEGAFGTADKVDWIKVDHHQRSDMLGMDGDLYPWMIIFCVVGLLFGFAMKGVFNVRL
ncbi:MAG: hypothetical protein ACF8XB_18265 [Planctomycetota bacterium JB042]